MGYILEVRNRFNYGHSTFKCQSLSEVRKILNDNLFDGKVKLYEIKEISLPCKYETAEGNNLTDIGHKMLWENACVNKDYVSKENK